MRRSTLPARSWRHKTGSGAGRGRRSQEGAGRGPFESTSSPEQSDRSGIPSGTGDGKDVPDHETVGNEIGASRSVKTGQKNACWAASTRQTPCGKDGNEAIKEEEKLQSNKDVTEQCTDFCEATTSEVHVVFQPICEEVLYCNILVFWWQLWHSRKTHISANRSSMQPGSRSFECIRVAVLVVMESQEAHGPLEEIRRVCLS